MTAAKNNSLEARGPSFIHFMLVFVTNIFLARCYLLPLFFSYFYVFCRLALGSVLTPVDDYVLGA
jgi:hypothetical protein